MKILSAGILVLSIGTTAHADGTQGLLTSGFVSAGIGTRDCSNTDSWGGDCGRHVAYDLSAAVSVPLGNNFSAQLDAGYEKYSDPDALFGSYQVKNQQTYGLHASYRDPGQFLAGVFFGYARGSSDVQVPGWSQPTPSGYLYGIEGQYYLDRVTFYGQIGKTDLDNKPHDVNFDGNFYGLAVRYYPSDDLKFEAGYGWGRSSSYEDVGDWGKAKDWFVEGKMRVMSAQPLYAFARYHYAKYVANTEDKGKENTLMIGLSYEFGSPSLFATDRHGATLSTSRLPARAAGWATALD